MHYQNAAPVPVSCNYTADRALWHEDRKVVRSEAEIDEFMDDALAELEEIRIDAKKALAAAASH